MFHFPSLKFVLDLDDKYSSKFCMLTNQPTNHKLTN